MKTQFSQYDLKTELAKKHSHSTYLASPTSKPEYQVVLTVFTSPLFHFPQERESLLLRAECIRQLKHPHLLPILDVGIEQEMPFVVREYLPHGSLRSYMNSLLSKHLRLGEALNKVAKVGQALAYAHEHHIFHGGIKPENILLGADGQIFLTDFNLVDNNDLTLYDHIAEENTFCYTAPEQFIGICDASSDQYALGCLTYELLTGDVPFSAKSPYLMKLQHNYASPPQFSDWVAHLPSSLEAVVLKTLAKYPAGRYSDVSQFLEAMRSVMPQTHRLRLKYPSYAYTSRTVSYPARLVEPTSVSSTGMTNSILLQSVSQPLPPTGQEKTGLLLANPFVEEDTQSLPIRLPANSVHGWSEDVTSKMVSSLGRNADMRGPRNTQTMPKRGWIRSLIGSMLLIAISASLLIYAFFSFVITEPDVSLGMIPKMTYVVGTRVANIPKVQPSVQATSSPMVQSTSQIPIPMQPINQPSISHGDLLNRSDWTASASIPNDLPSNALDGNSATRWSSGQAQTSGEWFLVDMGSAHSFSKITLDAGSSDADYPRGYQMFVSADGSNWGNAIASGNGSGPLVTISFATQSAGFIKIVQTGSSVDWWSIDEFNVYGASGALNRSGWTASASASNQVPSNALDGNSATRWSTQQAQAAGNWFLVDMGSTQHFSSITLNDGYSYSKDYPQGYQVFVSADGSNWGNAVASGNGSGSLVTISFATQSARFIKVVLTVNGGAWWSIGEFNVYS